MSSPTRRAILRRRICLSGTLAAVALAAAGPAPAGADHPAMTVGLQRVDPAVGSPLYTHGPDPRPPEAVRARLSFEEGASERAPLCASDFYQHVLYGRPAESADRLAEVRPQIQATVRQMDAVLNAASVASGGPSADYKVRCDASGQVAVDGFSSSGTSFAEIVSAARAAGFDAGNTDYLIFFDGKYGGSCGIGTYRRDESLSSDNVANNGGGWAIVYSGCWSGVTPMHESAHMMGAVQYGAPHSTGTGGHCIDVEDVVCYSPDGGDRNQSGTIPTCPGEPTFDCGFDDYFDSAPEPGEYLASHWNLGSPLNRFLAFDGVVAAPLAAPATGPGPPKPKWRPLHVRVPPRAKRLEISMRAAPSVGLYVRRRHTPTENLFACRSRPRGAMARCRIRRPFRGTWVVAAMQTAEADGRAIRIRARVVRKRKAPGPRSRSKSRTWTRTAAASRPRPRGALAGELNGPSNARSR